MSTQTLTIAKFLDRRWKEDMVGAAITPPHPDWHDRMNDSEHLLRILATQRAILAEHSHHLVASYDSHIKPIPGTERPRCETCASQDESGADWPCRTVLLLAEPYRAHPDWREVW